jgi:hypothetical protein
VSGENLNWFWNNWLYTFFYIDLSVSKVEKIKGGYNVYIDNTGGMAVPFDATITYADNSSETIHQTPAVWRENEKQSKVEIKTSKAVQSVKINGGIFVDAKENDNNWIIK